MKNFESHSNRPRQPQFGVKGRSTRPNAPAPPILFQKIEDFEFYHVGTTSYSLSVNTIERNPYVFVSDCWLSTAQAAWFPSMKQIFLQKAACLACRRRPFARVKGANELRSQTHKVSESITFFETFVLISISAT